MDETEKRILFVDDDVAMTTLYANLLRSWGFVLFTASNGERALEMLRLSTKDWYAIITDLRMPRIDGLEFLKAIGDLPSLQFRTSILMTGMPQEELEASKTLADFSETSSTALCV